MGNRGIGKIPGAFSFCMVLLLISILALTSMSFSGSASYRQPFSSAWGSRGTTYLRPFLRRVQELGKKPQVCGGSLYDTIFLAIPMACTHLMPYSFRLLNSLYAVRIEESC